MVQNAGSASVGSGGLLFRFTHGVLFNRLRRRQLTGFEDSA